jgi:sugar lactone lactonase YvrE
MISRLSTAVLSLLVLLSGAGPALAGAALFVTEPTAVRVSRIDASGARTTFATTPLANPLGLAFDKAGNLFVSETDQSIAGNPTGIIREFSSAGQDLGIFVPRVGGIRPDGLAFDAAGNLYTFITDESRIERFSPTGQDLGTFAGISSGKVGGLLAFDAAGNLYATTALGGNDAIVRFSPTGQDLGVFASGFSDIGGLAFDAAGNLYVSLYTSGQVERFSPTGQDLGVFASGDSLLPTGLAFDQAGNLYVADDRGGTIERFSPAGQDLGTFATGLLNPRALAFASPQAVPEPAGLTLLATGLGVLMGFRHRLRPA